MSSDFARSHSWSLRMFTISCYCPFEPRNYKTITSSHSRTSIFCTVTISVSSTSVFSFSCCPALSYSQTLTLPDYWTSALCQCFFALYQSRIFAFPFLIHLLSCSMTLVYFCIPNLSHYCTFALQNSCFLTGTCSTPLVFACSFSGCCFLIIFRCWSFCFPLTLFWYSILMVPWCLGRQIYRCEKIEPPRIIRLWSLDIESGYCIV